jgi:hypothetical protein
MNAKDLLNNSTVVAMIPSEKLEVGEETGATLDLAGVGRKVLVVVNAGTPAAGGTLDVVVHESDDDFAADDDVLYTFDEITAESLVEADLAPNKRYIRVVATVGVDVFTTAVEGIVYLEREIPSGI